MSEKRKTGAHFCATWANDAGLDQRSSHCLSETLGDLLAEAGVSKRASEHQIMAVLAHSSPQTAAEYTKPADRVRMAGIAMAALPYLTGGQKVHRSPGGMDRS